VLVIARGRCYAEGMKTILLVLLAVSAVSASALLRWSDYVVSSEPVVGCHWLVNEEVGAVRKTVIRFPDGEVRTASGWVGEEGEPIKVRKCVVNGFVVTD